MNNTTTFYATDRDLFDALTSKKKKLTTELLHELCHDRGIILSKHNSREYIVEYISFLQHDFYSFDQIVQSIASSNRSEKITSDDLPVILTNDELKGAVEAVSEKRSLYGEKYSVVVESENKTVIRVDYTEMDHSMTRLRQRSQKDAYIEIIKEDGKTKIRRPANEKVTEILEDIYSKLQQSEKNQVERSRISLQTVTDPILRTKFFTDLISGIPELKLIDVTYIKVDKRLGQSITPVLDVDDDEFEENDVVAQQMLGHVKKAALDGDGLLYSPEFQHLSQQGFYISSIIWQAIFNRTEAIKVEFEATFGNSLECTDFKYNARCFFKSKNGVYTPTRRQFEDHEKAKFFILIEKCALTTMKSILPAG